MNTVVLGNEVVNSVGFDCRQEQQIDLAVAARRWSTKNGNKTRGYPGRAGKLRIFSKQNCSGSCSFRIAVTPHFLNGGRVQCGDVSAPRQGVEQRNDRRSTSLDVAGARGFRRNDDVRIEEETHAPAEC